MDCSTPGFPVHHHLLEFAQSMELMMPSNHLIQSFPASGSLPMSQFFASGSQKIGASASVLPVNIQGWFPLGLLVWPLLLHFLVNCNYRKQSIQEGGTQRHWKVSVNTFDIFARLKNKRSKPEYILHVAEFVLWSLGLQGRRGSIRVPSIIVRPVFIFNIY